ncbi:cytochrome P450 [Mycolicibacterium aromaticivorans JS19b1 = JCM 16368]|uniref:Steroid C26-monooxygenase n=1 Tax=Mycolicibacterium aromaticivorans JS19b1 = JCM 16368 TaxID=1440774 RepID=A0A064CIT2_9MYCO|nr:cytochrome P450 [Mycolicibacterium aromaticivorans]KDE99586.1 cytochrome P450 [Mycolicibacterium aromaticivorans JS19b1 = JCM 16368]
MTAATEPQELLVKLLDPANRPNPYPVYRQILDRSPMLIPESTLHVMSSFADCDEVLRHPDSCSDRLKSTAAQRAVEAGEQPRPFGTPGFLFLDPPDHTRLRKLVSKAFSPRVVKALEPDITTMVDDLLDKAAQTSEFDAIEQLAHPLPVAVICRLLGVPIEDEAQFSSASTVLAQGLDPFATFTGEPQGLEERLKAGMWLRGYLRDLLERRRAAPRDDLMSGLIAVEESGDQLTEEEIVATCNLLLIAGHETTVNLIANAILAMLRHREHWTALSADRDLAPNIIEETLRYDPPVQLVSRVAGADMQIGETRIPKGDIMMLLLAAAHRDPELTERPNDFDPTRNPIRHLAFGHGPHFCLGAPLARMEAAVALTAVTRRFPHARLAAEPIYKPHVTLRGMARLDVAV